MDTSTSLTNREIGQALATARIAAGLSQVDVAATIGVDKRTLSAYEKGIRRIHAAQLLRLAKLLGVSLDRLLELDVPRVDGRSRTAHLLGRMSRLQQVPAREQKLILGMIDSVLEKHGQQP